MGAELSLATVSNEVTASKLAGIQHGPGLTVNPSQLEAVKLALTNRLALIQGPPGIMS